jgi:hypothetical protein
MKNKTAGHWFKFWMVMMLRISNQINGQDVINIYHPLPVAPSTFAIDNQFSLFQRSFIFNSSNFSDYHNGTFFNSSNYDGEYEMCLLLHP